MLFNMNNSSKHYSFVSTQIIVPGIVIEYKQFNSISIYLHTAKWFQV